MAKKDRHWDPGHRGSHKQVSSWLPKLPLPSCLALPKYERKLLLGENEIEDIGAVILLSREPIEYSSKVYKIAIQQTIDFDIIEGELSVREKRDGDSYVYGGMTRKLKKLFNDRSLTRAERAKAAVICDGKGILWVPGFRVRDGGAKNPERKLYVALAYKA